MGKKAMSSGTKPSTVHNSTWSPRMDGIPEPSTAEQAMMDAGSTSYKFRWFKVFQEIWPGIHVVFEPSRNEEATSRHQMNAEVQNPSQ
ncbi:hypothetical protein CRYUN_Cryun17cG0083700 [Craigia yunnanensis]